MRRQEARGKRQKIELLQCFVKCKFKIPLGRYPALVAGSGDKTKDSTYSPRSRYKNGVTSQSCILNLIGLLKYAQFRKVNSKSIIIKAGFTLVELAIVLVIIGLLVGGVLVGKDLISAAEVRSQISQIEKYQAAVNTFKLKYDYLPGDISEPTATGFGFYVRFRGMCAGAGDGNGVIEGTWTCAGHGGQMGNGEIAMFWSDLSNAGLIDQKFDFAATASATTFIDITAGYYPKAKLGGSIFASSMACGTWANCVYATGFNYFVISKISGYSTGPIQIGGSPSLTVQQAYSIDSKMDDGLPQTGNVTARYICYPAGTSRQCWSKDSLTTTPTFSGVPDTTALLPSATTCYDNGGVAGTQKYSVGTNGGNGKNCALSFKFQ